MSSRITDVKRIVESEMYRSLLTLHPDAVFILDTHGMLVDVNDSCASILGSSRADLLTHDPSEWLSPEQMDTARRHILDALAGDPCTFEMTALHQAGFDVWLSVTATPVVTEGTVQAIIGIAKDISTQKMMERSLRHGQERYESLKKYHPQGICSYDLDGNIMGANPAYEQITGYTLAELQRMNVMDVLVFPEDRELIVKSLKVGSQSFGVSARIRHKTGRAVPVRVTTVPIIIENRPIGNYAIAEDMTEHSVLREELHLSQRLFSLISDNSEDLITYSNPLGIIEYVSPSVRDLLGYEPEEVMGTHNMSYYHPAHLDDLRDIGQRILQGEDVTRFTCRVRKKNGNYLWFETTLKIMRDEEGNVQHLVGLGRNVSEQMNLQESLEQAVRIAGLTHWTWDIRTDTITFSDEGMHHLGFSSQLEKLTLERYLSVVHPDDLPMFRKALQRSIDTGNPFERVFRVVAANGETVYLLAKGEVLLDDDCIPVCLVGTSQDITTVKLLELELSHQKEQNQQLIDNALQAIGIVRDGRFVYMNPAGLKMFAADELQTLAARALSDLVIQPDADKWQRQLDEAREGLSPDMLELTLCKVTGETFIAEVLTRPFSESGTQVMIRDVTAHKKSTELVLKAEKLAAIGQLAAEIAREIRNPLTSLKGFVQLFRRDEKDGNRPYYDIMKSELDRINLILSELLVLSKPDSVEVRAHNVTDIMDEVIDLLRSQLEGKNVSVTLDCETETPLVACDRGQIKQVFINVVKNAIEAMPQGGILTVILRHDADIVCMQFCDEGEGISTEAMNYVGEPFYTTKPNGTGLGLSISRRIVEAHRGTLKFTSRQSIGSTVEITLPLLGDD